jgi:hypothetical protein
MVALVPLSRAERSDLGVNKDLLRLGIDQRVSLFLVLEESADRGHLIAILLEQFCRAPGAASALSSD